MPVPVGEAFPAIERAAIDKAIRDAETVSRFEFSVYVGAFDGEARPFAERLHAAQIAPTRSVLVAVDPAARIMEVVTGSDVRRRLDDATVRLDTLAMQSAFAIGDLAGGIARGVAQLGEHARAPRVLHADG
ncbi:MAG: DUF5130 family protein [Nocardioidaceae bacterium]